MAESKLGSPVPAEEAEHVPSPKTFMSPLVPHTTEAKDKITRSQIDGPTNVAVKAFKLLLDRAKKNRDESGQPASFQYTLWFMIALVVVVTMVGVVLLEQASRRQNERAVVNAAEEDAKRTPAPGYRVDETREDLKPVMKCVEECYDRKFPGVSTPKLPFTVPKFPVVPKYAKPEEDGDFIPKQVRRRVTQGDQAPETMWWLPDTSESEESDSALLSTRKEETTEATDVDTTEATT